MIDGDKVQTVFRKVNHLSASLIVVVSASLGAGALASNLHPLSRSETEARNIRNFTKFQMECVTKGDMTHLEDYMAPTMKVYASGGDGLLQLLGKPVQPPHIQSREEFRRDGHKALSVIVGQKRYIEDMVASGDALMGRWRVEGKVTGSFLGVPGNGSPLVFEEVGVMHFDANGRMTDGWFRTDGATILHQLGVKPADIRLPAPQKARVAT